MAKSVMETHTQDKYPQGGETKSTQVDPRAEEVFKKWQRSHDYVKRFKLQKWQDCYSIYSNKAINSNYDGVADDFVPETFTIVESLVANIGSGKPKFVFLPTIEEQSDNTDVLNSLTEYYWDADHMSLKALNWIRDDILYGNGILFTTWKDDKPHTINVPLWDFFVDPEATSMEDARYMGFRFLTSVDDLKKERIVDPETGEMTLKYQNLEDLRPIEGKDDVADTEKHLKERQMGDFTGSTLGKEAKDRQVECILYLDKEKMTILGNRHTVIFESDTPFQKAEQTVMVDVEVETDMGIETQQVPKTLPAIKPFFPFSILRNYIDPTLFYAKGDVEVILERQVSLNDLSSQKTDNISFVLNNMWTIDPQFEDMAPEIESLPGAVYPVPRGALSPIEKPMVTGEADAEMMRIKDEMRRATAADEVIQGVSQDKGRITATEVQAQMSQANQRFSTKLNVLESEGYAQLGGIFHKLTQIFVTQPMAVRIAGPEGVKWKDYDPYEFSGEYEPKVTLEATQRQMKLEEGQKYQQFYQLLMNSEHVNQEELTRVLMKKVFDLKDQEIEKLTTDTPAQQMEAQMAMMGQMGGMPGAGPDMSGAPSPTSDVPAGPLAMAPAMG